MTDRLRVGIIGTGWGSLVHAPAFAVADGYEVAAICARNPDRLAKAAADAGVEDTATDWRTFVRRDDLDIISVATPVETHHPIVLAALDAGRHVLCEKPLALTAAQAREMADAAAGSGRVTATCFELRWTEERLPVWDLVRDGFVGKPYFSRIAQSASYWHPSHKAQAGWMYDAALGGGYLAGLLSHDIDWIATMFGAPTAVCADVGTSIDQVTLRDGSAVDVTADDTTALLLRLPGGARAVISASVVGAHTGGWRFEAFGEDGTILATGGRGEATLRTGRAADDGLTAWSGPARQPRHLADLPGRGAGASSMIRAMALMLEDWRPAFSGAQTSAPSFFDGWLVQAVIEAARASSAGAGWVAIPDREGKG